VVALDIWAGMTEGMCGSGCSAVLL